MALGGDALNTDYVVLHFETKLYRFYVVESREGKYFFRMWDLRLSDPESTRFEKQFETLAGACGRAFDAVCGMYEVMEAKYQSEIFELQEQIKALHRGAKL